MAGIGEGRNDERRGRRPLHRGKRITAAVVASLVAAVPMTFTAAYATLPAGYNPVGDGNSMYNVTLGTGAQNYWKAGYTGQGVGIALIDTGVSPVQGVGAPIVNPLAPPTAGTITTSAGTGQDGYSGDGGLATSAQLHQPARIAVDAAGDLFIADMGNNVVREVSPTGTITTVAGSSHGGYTGDGGPATSAQLNQPSAVALDGAGDLYIADTGNNVVREVSASSGVITTVAGSPHAGYAGDGGPARSAQLHQPTGLAVDGAGDLYISDTGNNVVREVNTSGVITTVVGSPHAGYAGDGGPATAAQLHQPTGLAVDGAGDLYIADTGNNVVREVNTSGVISTVAGSAHGGYTGDGGPAVAAQLNQPVAVAVDASGDLYIADTGNNVVREVVAGTIWTVAGTGQGGDTGDGGQASNAQINHPIGVAVDPAGFVLSEQDSRVRQVTVSSAPPITSVGAPSLVYGPDLSFDSQIPALTNYDEFGHGTHMAGIIAGRDPSAPAGQYAGDTSDFVGMAPDAHIISVKVGDAYGNVDVTQIIAAIDWVVQHRNDPGANIRVINLSVGTNSTQAYNVDPLAYAAEQAWKAGIVVVAAAGNDGPSLQNPNQGTGLSDPAYDPNILAVGADDTKGTVTTSDDSAASFSSGQGQGSQNRRPDILAPGVHIASLRDPGSFIDQNAGAIGGINARLMRGSGSSQAAAVVSGAAALILSQHPDATPNQVKQLLMQTADPVQGPGGGVFTGQGEIDLTRALTQNLPGPGGPVPNGTGTGTIQGARGTNILTDPTTGIALTGEKDIFGSPVNTSALAAAEANGSSWSGGVWNGSSWSGSSWSGSSWSGSSWSGSSWSGSSWSGSSWSGSSWSGSSWSGSSWSGSSWSGSSWSGSSWSGSSWSGSSWSGSSWSGSSWSGSAWS